MKTPEEAKAEKVRLRERFLSGDDVRSRLGMADQQQDCAVSWAQRLNSFPRSIIPGDDWIGTDAFLVLNEGRREPLN